MAPLGILKNASMVFTKERIRPTLWTGCLACIWKSTRMVFKNTCPDALLPLAQTLVLVLLLLVVAALANWPHLDVRDSELAGQFR